MATDEGEEAGDGGRSLVSKWRDVVEDQWRKAGKHAEAYPYVWASYIVVYGSLSAFLAYKWRRYRKMEDQVCALQRRAAEAEAEARRSARDPVEPP